MPFTLVPVEKAGFEALRREPVRFAPIALSFKTEDYVVGLPAVADMAAEEAARTDPRNRQQ